MRNLGRKLLIVLGLLGLASGIACTATPGEVGVDASISDAETTDATDTAESAWVVPGNFQATLETPFDGSVALAGEPLFISGTVFHSVQELGTLQVTLVSETEGILGVFAPAPDGTFSFEWDAPQGGVAEFQALSVQAVDQNGAIATASTNIRVNSPPTAPTLSIEPADATTLSDLTATITNPSKDLEGDEVTYTYRWVKNQDLEQGTASQIPQSLTVRGDLWTVFVRAEDDYHESEEASATILIQNTLPTLDSCTIEKDGIGVQAVFTCIGEGWDDPDDDPILYSVFWHKEDETGALEFLGEGELFSGDRAEQGRQCHLFCVAP